MVTADQLRALHPEPQPTNGTSSYQPGSFNPEHGRGEAAIFRRPDGVLGFKCQHDSCGDKRWRDVRELVDGPARDGTHTSNDNAPADKAGLDFTSLSDLLAEPDEKTPWLVDGLLPQAGLSIIAARPKVVRARWRAP